MVRQDYTKPRLQVFRLSGGYFTSIISEIEDEIGIVSDLDKNFPSEKE
jgi:hypothetical protein